jgi:hypothetical protein
MRKEEVKRKRKEEGKVGRDRRKGQEETAGRERRKQEEGTGGGKMLGNELEGKKDERRGRCKGKRVEGFWDRRQLLAKNAG